MLPMRKFERITTVYIELSPANAMRVIFALTIFSSHPGQARHCAFFPYLADYEVDLQELQVAFDLRDSESQS